MVATRTMGARWLFNSVGILLMLAAAVTLPLGANAAGVITEFPIPTANTISLGITAGPDGSLWFAENWSNQIGRITTAGVVTEFAIPT